MSTTLVWKPCTKGRPLPDSLKRVLAGTRYSQDCELTPNDSLFIQGLQAAGVDGAAEVLEALEKHGTIFLVYEC
jgi:hypothetical protein